MYMTPFAPIDRSDRAIRFFDPRRDSWDEHFKVPLSVSPSAGLCKRSVSIEKDD